MAHRDKLEQALELMINEETEAVSDLLHTIVVEMAREIYEEIVEDETEDADMDCDKEDTKELDEDFGGDMKDDFAADIADDNDEVDADEMFDATDAEDTVAFDDAEVDAVEGDVEVEVEDRVEDLESALVSLRAEFDALMGDADADVEMDMDADAEMDMHADMAAEVDADEDLMMGEGTKLCDVTPATGMEKEGQHSGTGANSKVGPTGTEAPYTKAPSKKDHGGKVTDFAKEAGNAQGDEASKVATKQKTENNINAPEKAQSADMSKEGKFSGTGKNSKAGSVETKSPFTKKPS